MIINDKYKFAFIHIPKCAGTTVRNALVPFDSRAGRFSTGVRCHPDLGEIDHNHIPLFILKEFFSDDFDVVEAYWSFAIIRDPYTRFSSSIFQRLKMYSDESARRITAGAVTKEICESINFLEEHQENSLYLPPEYIHFQRQMDYVALDDREIVSAIYSIDNVNALLNDISERIGSSIYNGKRSPYIANKSAVYRNVVLGKIMQFSLPVTGSLFRHLPESLKQFIVDNMFFPWGEKFRECFTEKRVVQFIERYYAGDIRLWKKYGV